ncbi:MAG: hypothetical protein AAF531_03405 [Actinomycetota bacterium]
MLALSVLAAVLSIIIGVSVEGDAKTVWLAVGTSLLAAAVFSFLQILLITEHQDSLITDTVTESTEAMRKAVRKEISTSLSSVEGRVLDSFDKAVQESRNETVINLRREASEHAPLERYRPMDREDMRFNQDLNESMLRSNKYLFRGFTARYSVARLANLDITGNSFDDIRLLVVNPNTPLSVQRRQVARSGSEPIGRGMHANVVEEVWLAIVGALKVRPTCGRIQFCFVTDPPNDRYEIFDDEIYASYFTDPGSKGKAFPLTEKYGKESREYRRQLANVNSLFNSTYTAKLEIPQDESVDDLIAELERIDLRLDHERYDELAEKFEAFLDRTRRASSALPADTAGN